MQQFVKHSGFMFVTFYDAATHQRADINHHDRTAH